MISNELIFYREWLEHELGANKLGEQAFVRESFETTLQTSPAYQAHALVNGETHPIVATRKETKKCNVAIVPGSTLCIGDLVYVFNEYWLCVELYEDEFGMSYGELWMCNQVFVYQDHNAKIIKKHAILDDGSYSSGKDKAIKVTENSFNCYISLDEESNALFVDKRLAIGVIYDANGDKILEAGQIKWIDIKSKNFGVGSHLMVFGINDTPYNPEKDSVEDLICDYIQNASGEENADSKIASGYITINGRKTLRTGTGRTYEAAVVMYETNESISAGEDFSWRIEEDVSWVKIQPSGNSCVVSIKEDTSLSGEVFTIICECLNAEYDIAKLEVEVV